MYGMLEYLKEFVQKLEATIARLAEQHGVTVDEVQMSWEDFWYYGGYGYTQNGPDMAAIEAFEKHYNNPQEDDDEEEGG